MTTKIKIGIVGSRKYTDKRRIKDLIFKIKEKYGDQRRTKIVADEDEIQIEDLIKSEEQSFIFLESCQVN